MAKRTLNARRITITVTAMIVLVLTGYAISTLIQQEWRLAIGSFQSTTGGPFYVITDQDKQARTPGTLLRSQRLYSAPEGTIGWRVLYYSTDKDGNSIIASGLIVTPSEPINYKRMVVAWGHPTTGIAPQCAPSVGVDPFDTIEGLRALVKAGYVVVAPDYSNMGVSGPSSFLIGESEARTMIDIARAAPQLTETHAGSDVVFWGHSQGGHAALFSAQVAPTYATELAVRGVAVAAPATDLTKLLIDQIDTVSGVTISSYAFSAYSKAYNTPLGTVLTSDAVAKTPDMAKLCLFGQNKELHDIATPLVGNYLRTKSIEGTIWGDYLTANTPTGGPVEMPLFVAQGQKDTLVLPAVTADFVTSQKDRGVDVTSLPLENATHTTVALDAIPALIEWLGQRQSSP